MNEKLGVFIKEDTTDQTKIMANNLKNANIQTLTKQKNLNLLWGFIIGNAFAILLLSLLSKPVDTKNIPVKETAISTIQNTQQDPKPDNTVKTPVVQRKLVWSLSKVNSELLMILREKNIVPEQIKDADIRLSDNLTGFRCDFIDKDVSWTVNNNSNTVKFTEKDLTDLFIKKAQTDDLLPKQLKIKRAYMDGHCNGLDSFILEWEDTIGLSK